MPDIIEKPAGKVAPAHSATSDAPTLNVVAEPVIDLAKPPKAEPVDTSPSDAQSSGTDDKSGAADAQPQPKGEGGGKPDETSPQAKAAFARERNRRQAAEARSARLEAMLEQALPALQRLTQQPPEEPKRPVRQQYDDPDAYDAALEKWAAERAEGQVRADERMKAQKAQAESTARRALSDFEERKAAFVESHPDFDDVVLTDELTITPAMTEAIVSSEDGPAVAYWLGQNPDEAARIAKLGPVAQVLELGRIEAKLGQTPPRRQRAAPITPLRGRGEGAGGGEESMQAYGERRLAELQKARAH